MLTFLSCSFFSKNCFDLSAPNAQVTLEQVTVLSGLLATPLLAIITTDKSLILNMFNEFATD